MLEKQPKELVKQQNGKNPRDSKKGQISQQIGENRKKDCLLIVWLFILLSISSFAIGGTISRLVEFLSDDLIKNIPVSNSQRIPQLENCRGAIGGTPSDYLNCYLSEKYGGKFIDEVPPIGSVLDLLQVNTSWRELGAIKQAKGVSYDENKYQEKNFRVLFEIVETKLIAIATDNLQELNSLEISNEEVLPATFRFVADLKDFKASKKRLPLEARNWVITKRNRRRQLELIDTFVLLIMLGALGSIIFLIGDRIKYQGDEGEKNIGKSVISYIYRPIFGMLLAIATFILTASINGVTSTAKLENLRTESILFLAFSAGLLTDKVYEQIIKKAEGGLNQKELGHG